MVDTNRRNLGNALLATLVGSVVASAVPASHARPLGIAGAGQTTLALVDAHWVGGAQPAAVGTLRLYRAASGSPASSSEVTVPPRGWRNIVPSAPSAAEGGPYSGMLSTRLGIGVRTAHRWPDTGGWAADAVDAHGATGGDVWVPLVVAGYRGETSVVTLQNGGVTTVTFGVDVMALGAATPEVTTSYHIPANAAVTIDLGLDPAFIALRPNTPDGFIGTMRIRPPTWEGAVVHALVDVAGTAAVLDFAGVPASAGAPSLFVPLVHAALADDPSLGPEPTRLAVVNVGDADGEVRVSYVGFGGTCAGQTIAHPPITLAAGAMTVFDQGDGAGLPTGPSGLPAGCLATALLSADEPVVATLVARQTRGGRTLAAATNALGRFDGAQAQVAELAVPWFAADESGAVLDSDLFLMNVEGTFASVTVHLAKPDGTLLDCGDDCRHLIAPWSAWRLRAGFLPAGLRAQAGGAVVTVASPGRIVGIVRSAAIDGSGDAAMWPAVARTLVPSEGGGQQTLLPLVLRAGPASDIGTATPSRTLAPPSPTPAPTLPPFAPGGGMAGGALSTLLLANLERDPAFLAADLFLVEGDGTAGGTKIGPTRIVRDQPPLRPHELALEALDDLGAGRYAAIVVGGHAVGAAARTAWAGGAAVLAEPAAEGFELAVPFTPKGAAGETAMLAIHNPAGTFLVNVDVAFLDRAGQRSGGRSVTVRPNAVFRLAIDAPAGFDGWARLTSARPFGAQVLVDAAASERGAYDVGAARVSDAAAKLFAPHVVRGVPAAGPLGAGPGGARRNTRLVVANPGTTAALVRPAFLGTSGTCAGFRLSGAPFSVPSGGNRVVDLGAEPALPIGCTASATLTTLDGGILGIAIESVSSAAGTWSVAADRLMAAADAGSHWLVPRLLTGRDDRRTTVHVMNVGDSVATVALVAHDAAGGALACTGCSAVLAGGATVAFDGQRIVGAAAQPGAWAEITATGAVTAVYADTSDDGVHDDAMAAAVRVLPRPAVPPARLLVPQLEKMIAVAPSPTARPSEWPTPVPTASREPVASATSITGIGTATRTSTTPPTRTVAGTATPGGGKVTLVAVAVVNVTGNDDPVCAACDGTYDDADRAAAARSPLPPLTFIVRDAAGDEVARQDSITVDRIKIAWFNLGAPDAGGYDVSIETLSDGWQGCPNSPAVRHLAAADFPLGNARLDFHLSNTCLPSNRPPLEPVEIPGGMPTAAPNRRIAYIPAILRNGR